MGKRGPKPKGQVLIKWSGDFAYALGLIATDGNLSPNGRTINFTSKDLEQTENIQRALGTRMKVGKKARAKSKEKKYYVIQIGDVLFYDFLVSIGITRAKSKTIGKVILPKKYFFDFLRGVFDGDGYVHSYFDSRWKSSFLWYLGFCSASPRFLAWIRDELLARLDVCGHITKSKGQSCQQLKYAKSEARLIVKRLYMIPSGISLSRKKLKIQRILAIVEALDSQKGR